MRAHNLAADCQPQPGATHTGLQLAALHEAVKDAFQLVRRDAATFVSHHQLHRLHALAVIRRRCQTACAQAQADAAARRGKLDRVRQQVAHHLRDALSVTGRMRAKLAFDMQTLLTRIHHSLEGVGTLTHHSQQLHRRNVHFRPPGLQLGQVKQVIEHA